jgi:uncharacterized protein
MLGGCTGIFFQPQLGLKENPDVFNVEYEDASFTAADGTLLTGRFLPGWGKVYGTVLFLHGNAGNIDGHLSKVFWLPERGFNVFLIDYRGFGRSQGKPNLPGLVNDVNAAIQYLLKRPGVDPARIVIYGQSLGGALAVYTAATTIHRDHLCAVITDSSFASYRQIAREKIAQNAFLWVIQYPASLTVDDDYSPIDVIGEISPTPVLVIHGGEDWLVPPHHGRQLFNQASEPKAFWMVEDAGHARLLYWTEWQTRFVSFLKSVLCEHGTAGRDCGCGAKPVVLERGKSQGEINGFDVLRQIAE